MLYDDLPLQSEVVATNNSKDGSLDVNSQKTEQTVVEFLDEEVGEKTGFSANIDKSFTSDITMNGANLNDFLRRPVRINTFTWSESDAVGTIRTVSPWYLFFNDARIKYKLNNYSFLTCNLKVKVLINASPFYYGAMIMSYQPLPNYTPSTIVNDAGTRFFIPYSQRPHAWIFPQKSAGAEMELPYFNFRNLLRIQRAQDFLDMGTLSFINYTSLQSANGVSSSGVTVQVYAWAEDVQIGGPSVGLALQTDEYPISGPATAIAEAAGKLTSLPIIGPYATVTEMGARAIAAGARSLGYTNVPEISDTKSYRPDPFPDVSSSEIGYPFRKLTLDPKNELSIDPRIVGLPPKDELDIQSLVTKESYLCTLTWNSTNVTDDFLFQTPVFPSMSDGDGATNSKVYMTPMCWVAQMFQAWRGDIIFRFRIIASQYQKGRLRISYDPQGTGSENISYDPVTTSVVYTKIIDLGKDDDVEMVIPYQQATPWLSSWGTLTRYPSFILGNVPGWIRTEGLDNGALNVRVLTALSSPVATSSVNVLVSVRGGSNLEFSNPGFSLTNPNTVGAYSYLPPQSDFFDEDSEHVTAGHEGVMHPSRYLINMGEEICNLRQLLRRQSMSRVVTFPTSSTWYTDNGVLMHRLPLAYGYDAGGFDASKGIIATTTNFPFNFVWFHPITYISAAFIGTKGAIHWTVNNDNPLLTSHMYAMRKPTPFASVNTTYSDTYTYGDGGYNRSRFIFAANALSGTAGMAFTNQNTNTGLNFSAPNYNIYRFATTNPLTPSNPSNNDYSSFEFLQVGMHYNGSATGASNPANTKLFMMAGIGTDYTVHFFLNVPTLWVYSTTPTPA
nr:MAG: polyprotein [Moss marna-like virus 2]